MLHRLSFAPFPDTATETWFAALGDALEAAGTDGLLLANLTLAASMLPAVVVLPGRVAILRAPSAPAGALAGPASRPGPVARDVAGAAGRASRRHCRLHGAYGFRGDGSRGR